MRSKIREGATRYTALIIRAVPPAVRLSLGFRSVVAATITLATTAGVVAGAEIPFQQLVIVAPSQSLRAAGPTIRAFDSEGMRAARGLLSGIEWSAFHSQKAPLLLS